MQKQPGIRVPEVARSLRVSEVTVRNDLRVLAGTKHLTRVRGGAGTLPGARVQGQLHGPQSIATSATSAQQPGPGV
jgi:DeoR/GlpR family transcriptional regulator of sugar metabolism